MLRSVFSFLLLISCLSGFSQVVNSEVQAKNSQFINPNDISYLRVLDGIVLSNDYVVKQFERLRIQSKDSPANFEGRGDKQIMIIGLEVSELEHRIHQNLYSQQEFISKYKFPLDIRLPLAVNNKLLSGEEKSKALAKMTFEQIQKIEYLAPKNQKVIAGATPYGIVNLVI